MDKMKILVVDDESRMRKLVSDFLTRKGYAVIEAADGVEAVDTFMENKDIALIILDVMMPRMDGWEVCRQIRKDSKVPIIMLTAKGEEMDELQGFECGADEYIAKPFSPKILTARVDAIIRRAYGVDSNEIIEIGGITIDKAAHIVKIDGEEVELDKNGQYTISKIKGLYKLEVETEEVADATMTISVQYVLDDNAGTVVKSEKPAKMTADKGEDYVTVHGTAPDGYTLVSAAEQYVTFVANGSATVKFTVKTTTP